MPLRSLFRDHLWLKLFSVLLATLIWLTVRANLANPSRETTRRFAQQPVGLMTDLSEYRTFALEPAQVNITVRGPAAVVEELNERDIHAFVRMSGDQNVAGAYPVEVHAPHAVTVVVIAPRNVVVRPANAP